MLEKETKAEVKEEPGLSETQTYQSVDPPVKLTVYDLVYGTLFEPSKTYQKVAENPPIWTTVFLIAGLSILLAVMSVFTPAGLLAEELGKEAMLPGEVKTAIEAMVPVLAIGGFIFDMLFWFAYSALLHLIAEFYGGKGRAKASFAVYGLAGLPAVLLLPLQGLEIIFPQSEIVSFLSGIAIFAVIIWGVILLTIGLRETHKISTGRAFAVIATPWVAGALLIIIITIMFTDVILSLVPYLEQIGEF